MTTKTNPPDSAARTPLPTYVITGFLGSGKTSTLRVLLKTRPAQERWAVLINEFGEIGVDAALIGNTTSSNGVYLAEVPGGCLCCAAGVPFKTALIKLLRRAQPHRLLIEPTGLGHPRAIIRSLCAPEFTNLLSLQAIITVIDARQVQDPRYSQHPNFQQQLQVADLILANKQDLYEGSELRHLADYLATLKLSKIPVYPVCHGALRTEWLRVDRSQVNAPAPAQHASSDDTAPHPAPDKYQSTGWIFSEADLFNYEGVYDFFSRLPSERLKAVLRTDRGCWGFNRIGAEITATPLPNCNENRVELIDHHPIDRTQLIHALNRFKIEV